MENLTTAKKKKKKAKASVVKRERPCALFICLFCAVASIAREVNNGEKMRKNDKRETKKKERRK
jgi:hypothetical protein